MPVTIALVAVDYQTLLDRDKGGGGGVRPQGGDVKGVERKKGRSYQIYRLPTGFQKRHSAQMYKDLAVRADPPRLRITRRGDPGLGDCIGIAESD
ncbi:hypothetical protein ACEPAF_7847 [Sanghuangporus sanghuang]